MRKKQFINLYARYIGDYLAYVAEEKDYTGKDSFWPDYYSDDYSEQNITVKLVNVPIDIAKNLLKQGTQEQFYADGYEAANAAVSYLEISSKRKK